MEWFSIDSCNDVHLWETPEEAKRDAEEALEIERDAAGDTGWRDGVENIIWGRVHGRCVEVSRREVTEDDCCVPDGATEIVEYGITDTVVECGVSGSAIRQIVLELDELDWDAIQSEMAMRQVSRDEKGNTLPEGESNLAGAMVAEMVRDLNEYRKEN